MKNNQLSFIGSFLLGFALTHLPVLGQSPATPGPEHQILKKMEGTWSAKVKMGDDESSGTMTYNSGQLCQ